MEDIKYPIELEVITPLSVGAGNDNEWMRGIDYVQKKGKVYVLDIQKAAEKGIDLDRLTSLFLKYNEQGICDLLGNQLDSVSRFVFNAPTSTTNSIKTFLRTQLYGKPLIAGSSLKGSVRSALFSYLRNDETTNEEVFGNMKEGTDLMRFIRIADIEMPSTLLLNTKLFNLRKDDSDWAGGWKHSSSETTAFFKSTGFNTLYECVAPECKGMGCIILARGSFQLMIENTNKNVSHAQKKKELLNGDIRSLFHAINLVTKDYLSKEKAFFEKYPAERSEELIDNIDYLLSLIPTDDSSCLLKMSAGVGFHSITGDWQYEDYAQTGMWSDGRNAGKKKYKSRKTVEFDGRLQLMGFVRLRTLSQEEINQYEQALKTEHTSIIDNIIAPARQREEERLQALEKEQRRKLAAKEEAQKQQSYQELINLAKQCYQNNQFDDAIKNAQDASSLYPEKSEPKVLIEQCQKAKEIIEYQKNEQLITEQKFSQPLAEVIKGKTSAGNLIGTTAKWLKIEGNSFGETELQALLGEVQKLPTKELKRIRGKRSELSKSIGEEWTDKFFMALTE